MGTSVEGPYRVATDLEFLADLTYTRDGAPVVEQEIFERVFRMIDEAERFVVLDMFLFNAEHGGDRAYPSLTAELTRQLVRRKATVPELTAVLTTDEINTFYGAYEPPHLRQLRQAGVQVVLTDLTELRDSNAGYSAVWRSLFQWFGSAGPGWLPHPLTSRGQKVTARSYLRLFNMKANHRKLIATERECLVASANPHDASGFHSNIAWAARGPVCNDLLASERGVAGFSGTVLPELSVDPVAPHASPSGEANASEESTARVRFISEGKIRSRIVEELGRAAPGDSIEVAMFYLSDRLVVRGLLGAAERGAVVRLVLDPNRDAFGREKGGIPNRQVAWELDRADRIAVRWYDTRGEQFHTKLVMVRRADASVMFGGSANLTRRNLGDYNLEADLEVLVPRGHGLDREVTRYFERIWRNEDGQFTLDFEAFRDESRLKRLVYRIQELTGLSSF